MATDVLGFAANPCHGPPRSGARGPTASKYADSDPATYVATVHKSQGVTVERTHLLTSRHQDRHVAHVAMTRHRDRLAIYWSGDDIGGRGPLDTILSRSRARTPAPTMPWTGHGPLPPARLPRSAQDGDRDDLCHHLRETA